MDDFWRPDLPAEFTCAHPLEHQLYSKIRPRRTEAIRFDAPDAQAEADRFAARLAAAEPVYVLYQGVGTSGHLAFNEPGATGFCTSVRAEVARLCETSKQQLANDPNFRGLGYVPDQGIPLTIPAMLQARFVFTMVPLALKRPIMERLFATEAPTPQLPASILREHEGMLFLDRDSCPEQRRTSAAQ